MWRPMTEHVFPWKHSDLLVAVFDRSSPTDVYVLRCTCAEHGALFAKGAGMLSIHECGIIPIAWKVDDTPARDDSKWPPLPTDYLTQGEGQ